MYERGTLTSNSLWSALYEAKGDSILRRDTRGLVANGGSKQMTVRPGETIELTLPPPTGELASDDLGQLFAGQSTSIRLTTTRVR
jgi:hypothetical protein